MLGVGQQYQIAPGEGDIGGRPRAFRADRPLCDLHQHFRAAGEYFGNIFDRDLAGMDFLLQLFEALCFIGASHERAQLFGHDAQQLFRRALGNFSLFAGLFDGIFLLIQLPDIVQHVVGCREHVPVMDESIFFCADIGKRSFKTGFVSHDFCQIDGARHDFVAGPFQLIFFQPPVFQVCRPCFEFLTVEDDLFFLCHDCSSSFALASKTVRKPGSPDHSCFIPLRQGVYPDRSGACRQHSSVLH